MKVALSLVLSASLLGFAKNKNPADYPLIVHVLASSRETQLVYRGTDCTSSAYGEIDETDTLTARIYTTCSPNWAAYRYAFAELDVTNTDPTVNNTVRFLGQCASVSGAARASRILGGLGNAMAAVGGTPEQQAQAEQRSRRAHASGRVSSQQLAETRENAAFGATAAGVVGLNKHLPSASAQHCCFALTLSSLL